MHVFPLPRNLQECLHIDALIGSRIKMAANPYELVALELKCRWTGTVICTVAQVSIALGGERGEIRLPTTNVSGTRQLIHCGPP
jgi:hypothetical protein